ncbi:MAG: hypothetical protein HY805_08615 [Nitrospirae bacterium]|nr:hypothetical protein [Nitrospirota bacterium]
MTIREQTEEIERKTLHPNASFSASSKGRLRRESIEIPFPCLSHKGEERSSEDKSSGQCPPLLV